MKSLKLPALRAVVTDTAHKERRVFPLLLVSPGSISLLSAQKGQIWPFSDWGGAGLPLRCNRAHSPLQRGTRGFLWVTSQVFLCLMPLSLFIQLVHLLLVVAVQRYLDWEDGVLVVAVPFHAVAVQVAGVFHSDELFLLQFCDVFHDSGYREMYRRGNGSVAGMTLVGASIFTVEQIGVDGDGSVTEMQKEQFVGQREEILPGVPAH